MGPLERERWFISNDLTLIVCLVSSSNQPLTDESMREAIRVGDLPPSDRLAAATGRIGRCPRRALPCSRHTRPALRENAVSIQHVRALVPLLAAAALLVAWPARAQAVLDGKALNESSLIKALTPAPEEPEVLLRGFRPAKVDPARAAPGKASASLLITFVSNSATLTEHARASLDIVARALNADGLSRFKFSIEGHADPRGDPQRNLRLSESRAESVVAYLTGSHHIARERLRPVGKGDTELINTAQVDAPENRRVTIVTLRE
ncbi:MAG: OmpA family protein [Burkholderiaceae bacterium]